MNCRAKNVVSCIFFRSWLVVPLGIWIAVSTVYFWWFISQINVVEIQNEVFKSQLIMPQQISVITDNTYKVPVIPDAVGTICETIHIALVCMGKCTHIIMPILKSLLQHRQNQIHFHFIVDTAAYQTMTKLFDTWDLPDVKYTCYDAQNRLSEVRWIPNSHYSGVYPLIKLLYPDILPKTLNRVIALDSDLTILCDVAELWNMFRNMTDDQLIGLTENKSNWYLDNVQRWPAIGRGYNTGVMLLDLDKIRSQVDWNSLWRNAVNQNIESLKHTALADQDVINVIIKEYPKLVYNISCQYNIQTSILSKACYGEDMNNVKIIHWSSPAKYSMTLWDSAFFWTIHQSYVKLDGNLLREKLHRCSRLDPVTDKTNQSDICESFRTTQRVKLRTHLYYMEYSYAAIDNFDVTLVLQLSMDRLQSLERLAKYWTGPLSAAVYLSDSELTKFESFVNHCTGILRSRMNIGYHLVFKHDSVHYPVNYLRNVALENVNTPYVFLMDVDFIPMAGLYDYLRYAIKLIDPHAGKKCLVVAAFETQRYRASPPRSKAALKARLADFAPFRAREWPRGHQATNYSRWMDADAPYEVEWQSDYEPYLVVHRSVPKYDTRFSGFGWNKLSHSVELRAQGFCAVVLPGAFVVHTPHAPSHDITAFRADPRYRICLAVLKQEFMDDLKRKYNITLDEPTKQDLNYLRLAKRLSLKQKKKS